jgi:hypothetical protein
MDECNHTNDPALRSSPTQGRASWDEIQHALETLRMMWHMRQLHKTMGHGWHAMGAKHHGLGCPSTNIAIKTTGVGRGGRDGARALID